MAWAKHQCFRLLTITKMSRMSMFLYECCHGLSPTTPSSTTHTHQWDPLMHQCTLVKGETWEIGGVDFKNGQQKYARQPWFFLVFFKDFLLFGFEGIHRFFEWSLSFPRVSGKIRNPCFGGVLSSPKREDQGNSKNRPVSRASKTLQELGFQAPKQNRQICRKSIFFFCPWFSEVFREVTFRRWHLMKSWKHYKNRVFGHVKRNRRKKMWKMRKGSVCFNKVPNFVTDFHTLRALWSKKGFVIA